MVGRLVSSVFLLLLITGVPARAQYDDAVVALLHERLWTKRDAYDAAHILMTPMHSAYAQGNKPVIAAIRHFVAGYLKDDERPDLGLLTQLQFSYLVSQFVVLETDGGSCGKTARSAATHLQREVVRALASPAWQWTRQPFATMFARIRWKLEQKTARPSYLKAIIDEELFALAIAADLSQVLPVCNVDVSPAVTKAVDLGYEVLSREGEFREGGWVFQPGVWTDHPDYRHAGNARLAPDLPEEPVKGIGWDSSHSARWPLWLESFRCSATSGSETRARIEAITEGMQNQLLSKVILHSTRSFHGIRLRNFMTGENGVYRYGYGTVGPGGGYGPFGLSFTFNLGWWSFLGEALAPYYEDQLEKLPFSDQVMTLYTQPVVTDDTAPRPRHPLFRPEAYLRGDLIKTVLTAAKTVANHGRRCQPE